MYNQQQPQYNQQQYQQQPPQPPMQNQNPIGYVDPNQQMTSNVQVPLTPQPAQTSVRVEDVQPVMNQNNPNLTNFFQHQKLNKNLKVSNQVQFHPLISK